MPRISRSTKPRWSSLYREYKDIVGSSGYVVETERRFYLANSVELAPRNTDGEVYLNCGSPTRGSGDMYRPARFVKQVRVITFKDVNIEEVEKSPSFAPLSDASARGWPRCGIAAPSTAICACAGDAVAAVSNAAAMTKDTQYNPQ